MALPPIQKFHHEEYEDNEVDEQTLTDLTDEDFPENIEENSFKEDEYSPQEDIVSSSVGGTEPAKSDYDIQAEKILKKEETKKKTKKKSFKPLITSIIVILLMTIMVGVVFYIAKKQRDAPPKEEGKKVKMTDTPKESEKKEIEKAKTKKTTEKKLQKTKEKRNDIIDKRIKVTQLDNSFLIETSERVDGILFLVYTKNDKSIVCRVPSDTYTKGSEKEKEPECEGDIDNIQEYKLSAVYVVDN